jgi:predicted phosphodiesterase
MRLWALLAAALLAVLRFAATAAQPDSFRFVVIGDRTGESQSGVYERVWKDAAAEHPAFAVGVGDTIEGLHDDTAEAQWIDARRLWPKGFDFYLAPGNHDIWSRLSEELFRKYAGHPAHYSFDYGDAHFTVLDNSRADQFSAAEMRFLEEDLKEHAAQPVKFIVSHRPSWIVKAIIGDANFPLQQMAKQYGVRYVIAGHLHEMLHAQLDGVDYVSMVSAGGHLRGAGKYEDGWFFGYGVVDVDGRDVRFSVHELGAPFGQGRKTELKDWGPAGLR